MGLQRWGRETLCHGVACPLVAEKGKQKIIVKDLNSVKESNQGWQSKEEGGLGPQQTVPKFLACVQLHRPEFRREMAPLS